MPRIKNKNNHKFKKDDLVVRTIGYYIAMKDKVHRQYFVYHSVHTVNKTKNTEHIAHRIISHTHPTFQKAHAFMRDFEARQNAY